MAANAQITDNPNPAPYPYDTTLKGGYTLSLRIDDSLQHLFLSKEDSTIKELACTSIGINFKSLGYPGADFTGFFVLVHSFGSGNPHYIELIKKSTGENVLLNGEAWIAADEAQELLLYSEKDMPEKGDDMTLFNIKSGEKERFRFPDDLFTESQVLNQIKIEQVSQKQLVVRYETNHGPKLKSYRR